MSKSKTASFIYCLLAVIFLSGCMRGGVTLDVKNDGSADIRYKILAIDLFYKQLAEERDKLQSQGMTVEDAVEGNMRGFIARKHLLSLEEIQQIGLFNNSENIKNRSYVQKGFFYDDYIFEILFGSVKDDVTLTADQKQLRESLLRKIDFTYNINLPVAAGENNAATVENAGKNLSWKLNMVTGTQINARARVWHWWSIGLTGALAVAVGGWIWNWRRKATV